MYGRWNLPLRIDIFIAVPTNHWLPLIHDPPSDAGGERKETSVPWAAMRVGYCRVSTVKEAQDISIDGQGQQLEEAGPVL